MTNKSYRDVEVPEDVVRDVRIYMGDFGELNRIMEGREASDEKIELALKMYIHHFNNMPPKLSKKYGADDFPSAKVLFEGAVIQLLRMNGIVQSRNFLNFNDSGVSFTVNDKAQDYQSWIQNLMQTHREEAMQIKVSQNASEGFDHVESPEAMYPFYGG